MISKDFYKRVLSLLLVLNLWDAIATSFWVMSGRAVEANPFMATLLDINPSLFILTKTFLVSLCIGILWKIGERKLSYFLLLPVCILYIYVSIVHVIAFTALAVWGI